MAVSAQHRALFSQGALRRPYRDSIGDRPQRPDLSYGAVLRGFERPTPEHGTPADLVIDELVARAGPGLHAVSGPASSAG